MTIGNGSYMSPQNTSPGYGAPRLLDEPTRRCGPEACVMLVIPGENENEPDITDTEVGGRTESERLRNGVVPTTIRIHAEIARTKIESGA